MSLLRKTVLLFPPRGRSTSVSESCQSWFGKVSCSVYLISKTFYTMFFLFPLFGCGQVSSSLCVRLVELASLQTHRNSFPSSVVAQKKLYDVVVVVALLLLLLLKTGFFHMWLFCSWVHRLFVCLLVGFLMLKLLILLPCNNERYLMQTVDKEFALF